MKRSKFADEQIQAIVRKNEAGRKVADLVRIHGISRPIAAEKPSTAACAEPDAATLKQQKDENRRVKQIVAEQTLDIQAFRRS